MTARPRIAALVAATGAVFLLAAAAAAGTRVAPSDRHAIDAVLDRFIPEAVFRRDPAAARTLAAPELLAGTTRKQWQTGQIPVAPFAGRGTSFHGWTPTWVDGPRVAFDLIFHARDVHAKVRQVLYNVVMHRVGRRWLVQSFVPAVVYGSSSITSAADLRPGGTGTGNSRLSSLWFAVPAAVFGGAILVPLGVIGVLSIRRRRSGSRGSRELPPLPESIRSTPP